MKKGFTLVELMVVVAIIGLISSVTLTSFPSFRGRLTVDREASKIGLALRKAQQYSSGVRKFEETFNETTNLPPGTCAKGLYEAQFPAYGLSISTDYPKEYDIYADPNCDRISANYTNGSYTDLIESNLLEGGTSIQYICIDIDSTTPPPCSIGNGITQLDIWYVRPNPTLILSINETPDLLLQSAKIVIRGEDGSQKSIIVRKTGQISVQNEP